jgi:hypothetical protein
MSEIRPEFDDDAARQAFIDPKHILDPRDQSFLEVDSSQEADIGLYAAAATLVDLVAEQSSDDGSADHDPDIRATITGYRDLSQYSGDPTESLMVDRFFRPIVAREMTRPDGSRVKSISPATWADIEAAYQKASPVSSEVRSGLTLEQYLERSEIIQTVTNYMFACETILGKIPEFGRMARDYMHSSTDISDEKRYVPPESYERDFWAGLGHKPRIGDTPTDAPTAEPIAGPDMPLQITLGNDYRAEITYRKEPMYIAGEDGGQPRDRCLLQVTLIPFGSNPDPITRSIALDTWPTGTSSYVRYEEYSPDGVKSLAAKTANDPGYREAVSGIAGVYRLLGES